MMTIVTNAPVITGTRMSVEERPGLPEDDECRVELSEGVVVTTVSPPIRPHARVATQLLLLPGGRCPPPMTLLASAFDVLIRERDSALEPDLAVVPTSGRDDMDVAPLLVVQLGGFGEYVEVTYAEGDEAVELVAPFPVRIVPAELAA